MKYKFTSLLLFNILFNTFVFSQAFTENFEGTFPRVNHPVMTFGNNNAEVFERNNKKYQLKWYLNTDSLINLSYAINGTKSLVFSSGNFSFGARSSIIFNNVDLRTFVNPVLKFKSTNGSYNSLVKIALRKRNQWQYLSEPFALRQDLYNFVYVNNAAFLLEHITATDIDSVDIMIEGVSDNGDFSSIYIDDVSLSEATTSMQVSSIGASSTYGNNITTELDANVLEVLINTTGELNALNATQFQFSTDNSTNLQGIDSAKLFYVSRNGQQFIEYNYQFGNTIVNPNGTFIINGNYPLNRNSTQHTFILKLYFNKIAIIGSIVNFKCTSVKIGSTSYIPSPYYNSKTLTEIISVLNHANKSVVLSSNYRGLATATNNYQRSIFVYNSIDFGSTSQNYENDTIVGIQIKLAVVPSVPITGQLKVYLKVGNLGTVTGQWATEITKLKLVYDGPFTIPAKSGFYTIPFNKSDLPINNSFEYELAYEWVVSSGTANNLSYETFTSSYSAFSSGNTTGLPATLSSTTFRPLLRFILKNGLENRLPIFLPSIPSFNNINVNNRYDLTYTIYSNKSQADSFNFYNATRGINSPTLTNYSTFVRVPSKSAVTFYTNSYTFNLAGYDTIYNKSIAFASDQRIINNIHTTLAFPFNSPSIERYDYEIYNMKDQFAFGNNRILLNKYQVAKRNYVNSIILHIGKNELAIGLTIRPVILDSSNNIVYTGDNYIISEKDINTFTLLPINSFELNKGSYKIGVQYVQGDINQNFLTFDNAFNINQDWSYAMASNGQLNKLPNNIGLIIGFNSSPQNKSLPELGADRTVCKGYLLNAGVNANKYLWNTGDTSSSIVVNSTGKYLVRIQHLNSNNYYYDSVNLVVINNVKPLAKFDTSINYSYCQNDSIQLKLMLNNQNANITYNWYKNNTLLAQTVTPRLTITNAMNNDRYNVILNYKLDCVNDTISYTDTIDIKVNPYLLDTISILNTIDTICTDSILLRVNSFDTNKLNYYRWIMNGNVVDSTYNNIYTFKGLKNNDILTVKKIYIAGCINANSWSSDTFIVKSKTLYNFFNYTIDSVNKKLNFLSSSINYKKLIWNFGDGNIDTSNAASVSHQFLADGTYMVSLIAQNDCSADTFSISITVRFTSINNSKNSELSIYPNPTSDKVYINKSKGTQENIVKIYDAYGKYLGYKYIIDHSFSLSEYAEGLYFIHFENSIIRIVKLSNISN